MGEYVAYLVSLSFVEVVEESQEGKGQNWRQFSQMTFLYYTSELKLIVLLLKYFSSHPSYNNYTRNSLLL